MGKPPTTTLNRLNQQVGERLGLAHQAPDRRTCKGPSTVLYDLESGVESGRLGQSKTVPRSPRYTVDLKLFTNKYTGLTER